jgi:hypothetical protein
MDKQHSQEHSTETKSGAASNQVVKPNLVPMQLQFLPYVRIDTPYLYRFVTLLKFMILGRGVTIDHSCHNLTARAYYRTSCAAYCHGYR